MAVCSREPEAEQLVLYTNMSKGSGSSSRQRSGSNSSRSEARREQGNARWDPARRAITGDGYRIVLEFCAGTADVLEAKYAELTAYGCMGHCAPYDWTPHTRFALVDDPDGNTTLLSSTTASASA